MSIAKKKKKKLIESAKMHEKDTGSSNVQIAILNERIKELTSHLKKHRQDKHSRRGLLQLVANRRKHEKFVQRKSAKQVA
jgi:small subunit ribosomal protein S15